MRLAWTEGQIVVPADEPALERNGSCAVRLVKEDYTAGQAWIVDRTAEEPGVLPKRIVADENRPLENCFSTRI